MHIYMEWWNSFFFCFFFGFVVLVVTNIMVLHVDSFYNQHEFIKIYNSSPSFFIKSKDNKSCCMTA